MRFRVKALCRAFRQVEESETTPRNGVNDYLVERVLRPVMQGRAPTFDEIDYSRFDAEDIGELADYCERLESSSQRLEQFVGAVASIDAKACRSRRFC